MIRISLLTTVAAAALFSLSTVSMAAKDGRAGGGASPAVVNVNTCNGATRITSVQSNSGGSGNGQGHQDGAAGSSHGNGRP